MDEGDGKTILDGYAGFKDAGFTENSKYRHRASPPKNRGRAREHDGYASDAHRSEQKGEPCGPPFLLRIRYLAALP
jgi:hypothetical protein